MIASDFTDNSLTGITTVVGGFASITKTLTNDISLEGPESFQVIIRFGSPSGTIVGTSPVIAVADTSVPTYQIVPSTLNVDEGGSVIFTINTTGISDTTLYYNIAGSAGISASDFTSNSLTGSFPLISGVGSTTLTLSNDLALEGTETFYMNLRTGNPSSGPIVGFTSVITINDTSAVPPITSRSMWLSNAVIGQNATIRGTSNTIYSLPVIADPSGTKSLAFVVTWPSSSFVSDGQNQITPFTMGASNFTIMSDVSYIFGTGSFGVSPISGASESCCDPYGMNFGGITIFSARGSLSNTYQKVTGFSGSFTSNSGNVTFSTDGSVNGGNGLVGATGNFYLS